jgi:hypothetical protein
MKNKTALLGKCHRNAATESTVRNEGTNKLSDEVNEQPEYFTREAVRRGNFDLLARYQVLCLKRWSRSRTARPSI